MTTTEMSLSLQELEKLRHRANDLHRTSIVIDTHNDTVARLLDLHHDLTVSRADGFADLVSMRAGNFSAQFFACQVPTHHYAQGTASTQVHRMLDAVRDFVAASPRQLALARSAEDIRTAVAEGRQAVILCIEGAHLIGGDFALLDRFANEGVRYITLTHFFTSAWADSSTDRPIHGGLSELGRSAVARMNELRIVVDVSHASDRAFWQVLETSTRPVIASHSAARSLVSHPRNLTDDMIGALGARGGLIGVSFFPEHVSSVYLRAIRNKALALAPKDEIDTTMPIAFFMAREGSDPLASYEILMRLGIPEPTLEDCVDHIDHMVQLAGVDHVCLGMDHGAIHFRIKGLEDASKLPNLTLELLRRGYSDYEVLKLLGGNVLDFLERHDA